VAIDGPSGAYDDDPEQTGDSKPAGGECMATVTRSVLTSSSRSLAEAMDLPTSPLAGLNVQS